ncbi:MAG: virulence factor MviN [Anaerolineae bacterium]|nr:MAG: virulence factor MviN [Anaerolineae bacterium]
MGLVERLAVFNTLTRLVWRQKSVNYSIFKAAVTIGSLTVVVKIVATFKEILVANWFGTGDEIDAFLIAYLLAFFAVTIIAESFNVALVPTFIQVREKKGLDAAKKLFSSAMLVALILLVIVSILLVLTARYTLSVLGSGFDADKQKITQDLFYMLVPILTLRGLSSIWGAILNADERFALAAISPLLVPFMTLLALLLKKSVYMMTIGTVVGFAMETLLLALSLRRNGFSPRPIWNGLTPELRQVMGQYGPMVAGAFLMSSTGLIDQSMAAALGSGSVASLSYANRVVSLILNVGSVAFGTAILPHFSKMLAQGNLAGVKSTFRAYLGLILVTSIPFMLFMIVFSESIVRILYERGVFTSQDTKIVSEIQIFYLLQIPFYLTGILIVRLISSLKANHILMQGTVINILVNIGLNILFIRWLGIAGIALSTTGVYIISVVFLSYRLWLRIKQ